MAAIVAGEIAFGAACSDGHRELAQAVRQQQIILGDAEAIGETRELRERRVRDATPARRHDAISWFASAVPPVMKIHNMHRR